ncbi:MAG: hypothetical protein N2Z58_07310 [Fervidobacterium sp.]|nr:hypothetical protein [Fervidobacterium sp.]
MWKGEEFDRFLGDFSIDEASELSPSKREIFIFMYLLTKRKYTYVNQLADFFVFERQVDSSTIKRF